MLKLRRFSVTDGRALALVVIVGGLFTLQGSTNLDAPKIAYLLLAAVAVGLALTALPWCLSDTRVAIARPWLIAAAAMVAVLGVSLVVSHTRGTTPTSWLRDAAPYALLAATPILALACARQASQRWLIAVLAGCGALAAISFAVHWIDLRQLASLPIDRIVLPSETLAAALLALATAVAVAGASRRWWWAALAGAVFGLFFATGSRSTLLFLVVPIGVAVFAGLRWRSSGRLLLTEATIAVAVFFVAQSGMAVANGSISIPVLSSTTNPSSTTGPGSSGQTSAATPAPDRLGSRVSQLGSLVTDPGSDQSFQERLAQTRVAWDTFVSNPLVGVGPGYDFEWTNASNKKVDAFTLDTPLVYLAKFGLLGFIPLVLFAAAYLRLALELWRRHQGARIEYLAVVGFALVLVVECLQGSPVEDKGTSFVLILLIAIGLRALLQPAPASQVAGVPLASNEPDKAHAVEASASEANPA